MSEEEKRRRIRNIFDMTRIDYEGILENKAEDLLIELFDEIEGEDEDGTD